jgi:hypothetical protein
VALVRVYCGLVSAYPPRQLAVGSSSLYVTIVDDAGRVLDVCEIGDDSYGYAYLSSLLAERATGPYSVAIATNSGQRLVPTLLATAGWALAIVDDEITDDFAERFADEFQEDGASAPTQRRAMGLARALQGGALSATLLPAPTELVELKPVLATLGALATGRHAASVALREVLRELYPAALRAYPDPADPVALAVMDALPEPGTLASSASGRGRDAALAADTVAGRLVAAGLADQAAITEAITALRVAIAETPRRSGISRSLTTTVAETVRQSVAAVRAYDVASTVLVRALADRVSPPRHAAIPVSAGPATASPATVSPASAAPVGAGAAAPAHASAAVPASAPPRPTAIPRRATRVPVTASASAAPPPPPAGQPPLSPAAPQPPTPVPPLRRGASAPADLPTMRQPMPPPPPPPMAPPPVAPRPMMPPPTAPHPLGPAPISSGLPRVASAPVSPPPARSAPANRPVSPPPPPPPGITPMTEPRAPLPTRVPGHRADQLPVPAPRPTLEGPPPGSRADWPTRAPANDWAAPPLPTRASREPAPNGASPPTSVTPPWRANDLKPPEPPTLRLVEPTLPEELREDLGLSPSRPEPYRSEPTRFEPSRLEPSRPEPSRLESSRLEPSRLEPFRSEPYRSDSSRSDLRSLRLVESSRNGGVPRSVPPVSADDDDTLLIFAETRSAWFDMDDEATWGSAMDLGWQAAEQAARPTVGDRTEAGLPRRVPHANLVPGAPPRRDDRPLRVVRDPASIAENTSGYFSGWRRGQEVGGYPLGGRQRQPSAGAWEFHRDEDRLSG